MNLLSGHFVMRRQVSMSFFFFFFLLLLLYLITVACILEINLGSCWHTDECMGQRSTIHHNVQLFISLNNQYAVIQWSLLDAPTSTHVFLLVFLVCLSTVCYDYVKKQYGLMLEQRYFKGQRSSINHKIKLFCKLVQLLKYMCKLNLFQSNFHHNMKIHYLSMHWTWSWNIAASTRKHGLVYGIYQS